jgi:hypothetical protein
MRPSPTRAPVGGVEGGARGGDGQRDLLGPTLSCEGGAGIMHLSALRRTGNPGGKQLMGGRGANC